jgi:hypothetical protein
VNRDEPDGQRTRVRHLGRTLGIAVFGGLVAAFTVVCSVQICLQVWAPKIVPTTADCSAGTLRLIEAIENARRASADEAEEQAALTKFRSALLPAWTFRPALSQVCANDPSAVQHLHAVDRLRYAEEHAVRYGAVDLAKRRQEVKHLIPLLRKSSATEAPARAL